MDLEVHQLPGAVAGGDGELGAVAVGALVDVAPVPDGAGHVPGDRGGDSPHIAGCELEVDAAVTEDILPGVVSLPHGWGHDAPGTDLAVAARRPGVNSNELTDEEALDPLSGNAVLTGIPVRVEPVGGVDPTGGAEPVSAGAS